MNLQLCTKSTSYRSSTMAEKFKVVISGVSGRFPECGDVDTFKTKLYEGYDFVTTDNRKWPVGYKHKSMRRETLITRLLTYFLEVTHQ